jgi:hypothetical protein
MNDGFGVLAIAFITALGGMVYCILDALPSFVLEK